MRDTNAVIGDGAAGLSTLTYQLRLDIKDGRLTKDEGYDLITEIERAREIIRSVRRVHHVITRGDVSGDKS